MAPQPPIDAIREAVRSEMAGMQNVAVEAAARAVAQAHVGVMTGALTMVATLLAVRLLLFLGVGLTFVVALIALKDGSYQAAGVFVGFAVLVTMPLVWLERNPRVEKPKL